MIKKIENFSIEKIAISGQCFRIKNFSELNTVERGVILRFFSDADFSQADWFIFAFSKILQVRQVSQVEWFFSSSEDEFYIWEDYFDLKRDYAKIEQEILKSEDSYLARAAKFSSGLHMLRQDLWEVIVSFIISQQNNITKIKNSIFKLAAAFDENLAFPSPEFLAGCEESVLRDASLGYRAGYVREIAMAFLECRLDFKLLRKLSYKESLEYLMTFRGIGPKVANCIILFGLHNFAAFPKDVWIKRVIKEVYGGDFDETRFGDFAGLVQQYIFFYSRQAGGLSLKNGLISSSI